MSGLRRGGFQKRGFLPGTGGYDTPESFHVALRGWGESRGNVNKLPVPYSPHDVGYAPSQGECISRTGRLRPNHEYDHDELAGSRCFWCDKKELKES